MLLLVLLVQFLVGSLAKSTEYLHLVPYGSHNGDANVDVSKKILSDSFPLYFDAPFEFGGEKYNMVYVTKNGVLLLVNKGNGVPVWDNTPQAFPLEDALPIIAGYWMNPRIIQHGDVWYRQTVETNQLDPIKRKIDLRYPHSTGDVPEWAFIVTWVNVTFRSALEVSNTFQVVLTSIGDTSYLILQYKQLMWGSWEKVPDETLPELADVPTAIAGYSSKDGEDYFMLPLSASKIRNYSNVNIPGLWIFRVGVEKSPPTYMEKVGSVFKIVLSILAGIVIGVVLYYLILKIKDRKISGRLLA